MRLLAEQFRARRPADAHVLGAAARDEVDQHVAGAVDRAWAANLRAESVLYVLERSGEGEIG